MTGGVLRIEQRAALLPYLLRLMRIPTTAMPDNPKAHPVVIKNRGVVETFIDYGTRNST
jgi:hypothetical protein